MKIIKGMVITLFVFLTIVLFSIKDTYAYVQESTDTEFELVPVTEVITSTQTSVQSVMSFTYDSNYHYIVTCVKTLSDQNGYDLFDSQILNIDLIGLNNTYTEKSFSLDNYIYGYVLSVDKTEFSNSTITMKIRNDTKDFIGTQAEIESFMSGCFKIYKLTSGYFVDRPSTYIYQLFYTSFGVHDAAYVAGKEYDLGYTAGVTFGYDNGYYQGLSDGIIEGENNLGWVDSDSNGYDDESFYYGQLSVFDQFDGNSLLDTNSDTYDDRSYTAGYSSAETDIGWSDYNSDGYDDGSFTAGAMANGETQFDGMMAVVAYVIGVIVNAAMFVATLEIWGISIIKLFSLIATFSLVMLTLKVVRG